MEEKIKTSIQESVKDFLESYLSEGYQMECTFSSYVNPVLKEFKVIDIFGKDDKELRDFISNSENQLIEEVKKMILKPRRKKLYESIIELGGINAPMYRLITTMRYYKGGLLYEDDFDLIIDQEFRVQTFDKIGMDRINLVTV